MEKLLQLLGPKYFYIPVNSNLSGQLGSNGPAGKLGKFPDKLYMRKWFIGWVGGWE